MKNLFRVFNPKTKKYLNGDWITGSCFGKDEKSIFISDTGRIFTEKGLLNKYVCGHMLNILK